MSLENSLMSGMLFVLLAAILMPGHAAASECGVDVYGLDVQGGRIVGYISNTGDSTDNIEYTIYIDDDEAVTGSFDLKSHSVRKIEHYYSFDSGEHTIELEADSDCGDYDSEEVVGS